VVRLSFLDINYTARANNRNGSETIKENLDKNCIAKESIRSDH